MTKAQAPIGHWTLGIDWSLGLGHWSFRALPLPVLRVVYRVVRALARDRDVVRVALGHARAADAAEPGLLSQRFDVLRPAVAHAGAQAAHELVDEIAERPAVRHAAFHAFGDELAALLDVGLPVAVARAGDHRAHRTHAAVHLITTPLVDHRFAGRFV